MSMNLPTKLTFSRIFMIPLFVAVYFIEFPGYRFVALGIFALACFTDFLDGYLARRNNQVTTLGKFLDPIADKLLVACALIAVSLVRPVLSSGGELFQTLTGIFTMIILCRELLVSAFRIVAATKGVLLAADFWGKLKTNFQMFSMILLIPYTSIYVLNETAANIIFYIGFGLLAAAAFFTVMSGANYLIKNKNVLKDSGASEKKSDVATLAAQLTAKKLTLGIVESFTGGYLTSLLTSISGASAYLKEAVVCYSYNSKSERLCVEPATLEKYGAVSNECIREMLAGVLNSGCDIAVATTGNAGPTAEKDGDEGLCFVGAAYSIDGRTEFLIEKHNLKGDRAKNICDGANLAVKTAIALLK